MTPAVAISYRRPRHTTYPHVVKFSGGRSSALTALSLAENGTLKPERGDLVVFANTSAEHPATYQFAKQVSTKLENDYELPVLWYEFCTVEDAAYNTYRRFPSYRLVSRNPIEYDPNGYSWQGEVFEEMISWQQMLPTSRKRSCTYKLKLGPSHQLLSEWFSGSSGPAHAGHYRPDRQVTAWQAALEYERNGGGMTTTDYARRAEYMMSRPPNRSEQKWQDYTISSVNNLKQPGEGLWGRPPIQHVTLLGLRADESRRVNRVLDRTFISEGASSSRCGTQSQPGGEHPHFPLYDSGITEQEVRTAWQKGLLGVDDLTIDSDLGNCVFCFMKGANMLKTLARLDDPRRIKGTPSDIGWWEKIEQQYRRTAPTRNGNGTTKFGFLGAKSPSYSQVRANNYPRRKKIPLGASSACDCTD